MPTPCDTLARTETLKYGYSDSRLQRVCVRPNLELLEDATRTENWILFKVY